MTNKHIEEICKLLEEGSNEKSNDYKFYKSLGLTDAQSLMLSLFVFNSTGWRANNKKKMILELVKKMYSESDKSLTFSEYFVSHMEEIADRFDKEWKDYQQKLEEERNSRSRGVSLNFANSTAYAAPVPPSPAPVKEKGAFLGNMVKKVSSKRAMGGSVSYNMAAPMEAEACFMAAPETGFASANFVAPIPPVIADTESYDHIEEKGFQNVSDNPTSTFRTTCNTASIGTLMNHLRAGRAVKPSSIRIEELMNFFDYNLEDATDKFNIHLELCDKPNSKNKLLFIGLKAKKTPIDKQNIVILLDTSGSMSSNDVNMQKTIMSIVSGLKVGDRFSLVTYSDIDHTIIDSMLFDGNIDKVIEKLYDISIEGCTYGSAGIETAYKIAEKNYIKDAVNRVVLITDGDLNFGINSNDGLEKLILKEKKKNVFLSVIGMGIGNYKDDKLEVLAKNGNGNYCVVNDEYELRENVINRYDSMMNVVAKDVKAQVEFNPAMVKSYRLIGYENREISHSDFKNDKVIAEPFGSGSVCVALYELELADGVEVKSDLKYQIPVLTGSKEFCTVSVRYKEPLEDVSELISESIGNTTEFSGNVKLAYICYAVGEKFRESSFGDLKDELMARYIAETFDDEILKELNKDKLELLKFLIK